MASINPTAADGVDNILRFGKYYQTIVAMEPDMVDDKKVLHPEETSFIRRIATYDDSTAAAACRGRLDLRLDYYYAVKHQITSFQRVWDAILEEKRRYDAAGWLGRSRSFMDSFQLCSYLIPQRVSIGFFGPCETSFDNIPVLNYPASYQSQASTVVNSPTRYTEYKRPVQDRGLEERFLSEEEEYLEALALSPIDSNESFEDVEPHGGVDIISISSDEDDSDSEYSDSGDSNESNKLQFPLELDDGNALNSSLEPDPYHSKQDLTDALWERLFSDLPNTQHAYEEIRRDESIDGRLLVPRVEQPPALELEDMPKKRKLVVGDNSGREYEKHNRGKRQRAV